MDFAHEIRIQQMRILAGSITSLFVIDITALWWLFYNIHET